MSYAGLSPPHAVKRRVQFYETLMPRNPFPRFRRGPEATHCGRIGTGYDDLNAERPIFQRNGTIGCPGVRVCHSHALYMAWRVPMETRRQGVAHRYGAGDQKAGRSPIRCSDHRISQRRRDLPMSAEEYREHAWACERMARSLSSANAPLRETMREVAAQWRRLAEDAEAEARFQK